MDCKLCRHRMVLADFMANLDSIEDIGSDHYDDWVGQIYNDCDSLRNALNHVSGPNCIDDSIIKE